MPRNRLTVETNLSNPQRRGQRGWGSQVLQQNYHCKCNPLPSIPPSVFPGGGTPKIKAIKVEFQGMYYSSCVVSEYILCKGKMKQPKWISNHTFAHIITHICLQSLFFLISPPTSQVSRNATKKYKTYFSRYNILPGGLPLSLVAGK